MSAPLYNNNNNNLILSSRQSQTPDKCMRPPCLWDKAPPPKSTEVYRFELVTS